MKKNEIKFWEAITGEENPDWTIRFPDGHNPAEGNLSKFTARIYAIDTSSDWISAGAITPDNFRKSREILMIDKSAQELVIHGAAAFVSEVSKMGAVAGDPILDQCLASVVAALSTTKTFETGEAFKLEGHWLYVVYRMQDGKTLTGRPIAIPSPGTSFLDIQALRSLVQNVINYDLSNGSKTSVGSIIQKCGGLILADLYKKPDQQRPSPRG